MNNEYVQQQSGAYRITGSRVSLDSIVYAFWNGESAETIAQSFPVLKLEQVYSAIALYLANRAEVDRYLEQQRAAYEAKRQAARDADPMFYQKLAANLLMKVRFQADADLHQVIVTTALRRMPAIDFQTATVPALRGSPVGSHILDVT